MYIWIEIIQEKENIYMNTYFTYNYIYLHLIIYRLFSRTVFFTNSFKFYFENILMLKARILIWLESKLNSKVIDDDVMFCTVCINLNLFLSFDTIISQLHYLVCRETELALIFLFTYAGTARQMQPHIEWTCALYNL